jgi:hypothetical protein
MVLRTCCMHGPHEHARATIGNYDFGSATDHDTVVAHLGVYDQLRLERLVLLVHLR